jgi:hypothetical protein
MTNHHKRFLEALGITPGLWKVEKDHVPEEYKGVEGVSIRAASGDKDYVASMCDTVNVDVDARLIAAAPAMLCALVELIILMEPPLRDFTGVWVYRNRKVVESATGRSWAEVKKVYEETRDA